MEKSYLQWNVVNFVTVLVMAVVGVTVTGAVVSIVRQRLGAGEASEE